MARALVEGWDRLVKVEAAVRSSSADRPSTDGDACPPGLSFVIGCQITYCYPRPRALPVMRASEPIVPESVEVAVRSEAVRTPFTSLSGENLLNPRHRCDRRREARRRNG